MFKFDEYAPEIKPMQEELPFGAAPSRMDEIRMSIEKLEQLGATIEANLDTPFYLQNVNYEGKKQ